MPYETEILANESGIQYQGIDNAESETDAYPIQALIAGFFDRGRFDKPMIINQDNIRGMLGHDVKNPYYLAVQDILDSGVPSIQVLRLNNNFGVNEMDGLSAYQVAVKNGFNGNELQWLESLKGIQGLDGISAYQVAVRGGFIGSEAQWLHSLNGAIGLKGVDGLSAYQIAVKNGYVGTESQWLTSINGVSGLSAYQLATKNGYVGSEVQWLSSIGGAAGLKGADGISAYQVAVKNGYVGTEPQWLLSLKGAAGLKGTDGTSGLSAYALAVNGGFVGSEAQWLLSLKGAAGLKGTDGTSGLSAYALAVNGGFVGSEAQWLLSLKGKDGGAGSTQDILSIPLANLNIESANGAITANDTLLTALAKIQKQINNVGSHSHGGITDIGGEGYYPFDVSDGTLYTVSQKIIMPIGYYRIAAAGLDHDDKNSLDNNNISNVFVKRTLTDLILVSTPLNGVFQYSSAAIRPNNSIGIGGWSDNYEMEQFALKNLFSQAPSIAKGANAASSHPNVGGSSSRVAVSAIYHFTEPTELSLIIEVPSDSTYYKLDTAGTGFVWIRQIPEPI